MSTNNLPVAVIGAGPIGLAAAAHLAERQIPSPSTKRARRSAPTCATWPHVRIFTTWEQSVDTASRRLLAATGWSLPDPNALPTGEDIYRHYLKPLARHRALSPHIRTDAKVVRITGAGADKMSSKGRDAKPFELRIESSDGARQTVLARAVIDASGTWRNRNPLGGSGLEAEGERRFQDRIAYGIPDVLGGQRARYADKIAVVGGL